MAGLLHFWNEWEVQVLVVVSFALQVFLLIFARMRRRNISNALRILLWLMYLLADSAAIYTLGHMSISCKPDKHQKLMAFWAPFLLVHLGGQDTITAYALEDNQLWLRHLLTFVVQSLGAAYVLYKNISSHGTLLVMAAILIFIVGVLKNGERVWALSSSNLESISRFLDNITIEQKYVRYTARTQFVEKELDDEVALQGAHDLLYVCMGQFVDDKIWPSIFQMDALRLFHEKGRTYELIEMQLSLMYDILYTKAAVIHTRLGWCIRVISLLGMVTAFFLFQFSTVKGGYNRVDASVTYILLAGACLLEMVSMLSAMGSTWTCAKIESMSWDWLHRLLLSLRRCVSAARTKRWSGYIGQHNLMDSGSDDAESPCSRMISVLKNDRSMISEGTKELLLEEITRMVVACKGNEHEMRSYRGQCVLKQHDGFLKDLTSSTDMDFDESIITWHLATNMFINNSNLTNAGPLVDATKALSNYMMLLLMERHDMLPSPVRPRLYAKAKKMWSKDGQWLLESIKEGSYDKIKGSYDKIKNDPALLHATDLANKLKLLRKEDKMKVDLALLPATDLANKLLRKEESDRPKVLQVLFGVWVEMLSYSAHHCSRSSHARHLNSGGEFATIVWLLTTFEFYRINHGELWFVERNKWRVRISIKDLFLVPCCFLSFLCICCMCRMEIVEALDWKSWLRTRRSSERPE